MEILGAIIGDICGSIYEWHNETDPNKIELFKDGCRFTDDTVLTIGVMDWLNNTNRATTENEKEVLILKLQRWATMYPGAGYGHMFRDWLVSDDDKPYGSFGNGSAMRVSACGFAARSFKEAIELAKKSAEVTHDHPEGIKGAQAVAAAIYLARTNHTKDEIRYAIEERFEYDLHTPLSERPKHKFDATCQTTVPEAFMAFFDSTTFTETIVNSIAIGGDSDTIAAIAGSIAAAYYTMPSELCAKAIKLLPADMINVIEEFGSKYLS